MFVPALPKVYDIVSENGWSLETKKLFVENLLLSTNRPGVDKVIDFLNNTDFYTAPASTVYHSNCEHGLLNHSIIVYVTMMQNKKMFMEIDPKVEDRLSDESIALCSILHDICKCCFYKMQTKWKKDDVGQWQSYTGYAVEDVFPIGHGEKSVIMLQNIGLSLNPDEMLAIRYHMGMWGDGGAELKYSQNQAVHYSPLVPLLQMADYAASSILEPTYKN